MLDIFALSGLEWIFDKVETRYGRTAAWLATAALTVALIGSVVFVLIAIL